MSDSVPACLILAAPFSGAPVLAAMLGRHPDLFALPELNLGLAPTVNELLHLYAYSQSPIADGLLRSIASLQFNRQDDTGIADARAWLSERPDWTVAQVLQELATRAAPRGLVLYDADSVLRPIELLRLVDAVHTAPIIHLVRHPWSQGVVAADRLADHLYLPPDFKDHSLSPPGLDPQLAWLRANRNIERWVTAARAGQVLRLHWEKLIGHPEEMLGELCVGLGLRFDDEIAAAMTQYEDWKFWGYGPQAAPYGLDAEALEAIADPVLDLAFGAPTLVEALPWRQDGVGFAPEVFTLATGFGYA